LDFTQGISHKEHKGREEHKEREWGVGFLVIEINNEQCRCNQADLEVLRSACCGVTGNVSAFRIVVGCND